MKFKVDDEVIVVNCDKVVRDNLYIGLETTIHALGNNPNGIGYIILVNDKPKFLWECELIINREKRLKQLLD